MRRRVQNARFDWRGGVNVTFSPDALDASEVQRAQNVRLGVYGALTKRGGSRRRHTTALHGGAPVAGLYGAYDSPVGRQIVCTTGQGGAGRLYHKAVAAAAVDDFTEVATLALPDARARFQPFRVGADIHLFFAQAGLYEWDGAVLAAVATAPAGVVDCAAYKSRLYVCAGKRLYWSERVVPNNFTVSETEGGFADVETYDTEDLVALAQCGGSLLLFKEDSIARYRGVAIDEIRIDTETEGVSGDLGCIARGTCVQIPEAVFFLSAEGACIATEAGIQPVGLKIEREIDQLDKALWGLSWAQYDKARRELWLVTPAAGAGQNSRGWCWNLRTKSWSGPWPIAGSVLSRYEHTDGTEHVLRGGYDGWIREEDVSPALDDQLADGSAGTPVELDVELPPEFFGDPGAEKSLQQTLYLQADLGATYDPGLGTGGSLTVAWASERGAGNVVVRSLGPGVRSYPIRLRARGRRITLTLTEATREVTSIHGLLMDAALGHR